MFSFACLNVLVSKCCYWQLLSTARILGCSCVVIVVENKYKQKQDFLSQWFFHIETCLVGDMAGVSSAGNAGRWRCRKQQYEKPIMHLQWLAVLTEGGVQVVGCNGRPGFPVGSHLLSSELSCSGSAARGEHGWWQQLCWRRGWRMAWSL